MTAQLEKKELFRAVKAEVNEGIVTISGEVPLYIDKVNAEKRWSSGRPVTQEHPAKTKSSRTGRHIRCGGCAFHSRHRA